MAFTRSQLKAPKPRRHLFPDILECTPLKPMQRSTYLLSIHCSSLPTHPRHFTSPPSSIAMRISRRHNIYTFAPSCVLSETKRRVRVPVCEVGYGWERVVFGGSVCVSVWVGFCLSSRVCWCGFVRISIYSAAYVSIVFGRVGV